MPLSWSVVVPVPCARLVDVRVICPRAGRVVPKWSPTALFVLNPDPRPAERRDRPSALVTVLFRISPCDGVLGVVVPSECLATTGDLAY